MKHELSLKMKNGSFRLMVKAEHAVDLNLGEILSAQVHRRDLSDTQTLGDTITDVAIRFKKSEVAADILAVVADKGYHILALLAALQAVSIRIYVSTPATKNKRVWVDKAEDEKRAYTNNAKRNASPKGYTQH